ncbi:hypothetical protein [Pararhizobium sp. DWP1-1-3]|uniref:hypothetical protein n=1 Tax=Pararhizobium sp. DWP1-1-3 TaxID=2804652 RepID=UPI003CE96014
MTGIDDGKRQVLPYQPLPTQLYPRIESTRTAEGKPAFLAVAVLQQDRAGLTPLLRTMPLQNWHEYFAIQPFCQYPRLIQSCQTARQGKI